VPLRRANKCIPRCGSRGETKKAETGEKEYILAYLSHRQREERTQLNPSRCVSLVPCRSRAFAVLHRTREFILKVYASLSLSLSLYLQMAFLHLVKKSFVCEQAGKLYKYFYLRIKSLVLLLNRPFLLKV